MSRPALTSNISDSATSDTTSRPRSRCEPEEVCRPPSLSVLFRSGFDICQAGASPKIRPLRSERAHIETQAPGLTPS